VTEKERPGADNEVGKSVFRDGPLRRLRRFALRFSNTPLHPQWVSFAAKRRAEAKLVASAAGKILDVGCGESLLRTRIPDHCHYVGLDSLLVGRQRYATRPDVFGDAGRLPFAEQSFDTVWLLDVLEHLPCPEASLAEIARVLEPGGTLHITIPFLYPLHDEPYDFQRFTEHGLRLRLGAAGFESIVVRPCSAPAETSALLANITLAAFMVDATRRSPVAYLLGIVVLPLVALINVCGFLLGAISRSDRFMPCMYSVECLRKAER